MRLIYDIHDIVAGCGVQVYVKVPSISYKKNDLMYLMFLKFDLINIFFSTLISLMRSDFRTIRSSTPLKCDMLRHVTNVVLSIPTHLRSFKE